MKSRKTSLAATFLAVALAAAIFYFLSAPGASQDVKKDEKENEIIHPWDGAKKTPVHLLQLRDENGQLIIPTESYPFPYSSRHTCEPCHNYDTISKGFHFNAPVSENDGRPGEPWFLTDPKTGTVLPLSYREWAGCIKPEEIGLTAWNMTILFGRNMPGGGTAEPTPEMEAPDPEARWNVSGKAEINCLACHNASPRQDHGEWAKQVARENLRWASTASSGIGQVGGMASRLHPTWNIYDGPNRDDQEWAVAPQVKYNPAEFDSRHRYYFEVTHKPHDSNCLACHSATPVGQALNESEPDIHRASGLQCADCHRNDLGHDMTRGYEGEAAEKGMKNLEGFTCRGCHLGEDAEGNRTVTPGRQGAPYPTHAGIPLVHFRRLSCTVCHSGPVLKEGFGRVRTSAANRLGIYGLASWATDEPVIFEPVYAENGRGKIAPHRLVWPSFWGRLAGDKLEHLKPEEVMAAAGDVLKSEEHIAGILMALSSASAEGEIPVLISGDHMFQLNVDGGLEGRPYVADKKAPWFWAVLMEGAVSPFVPDFDPDSLERDPEIEARIFNALTALSSSSGGRRPVFLVKSTVYRLTDGYLETVARPEDAGGLNGFYWSGEKSFEPLATEFDVGTVTAKAGTGKTLTEEQVSLVLQNLKRASENQGQAGDFVFVAGGWMFSLNQHGKLVAEKHRAAEPVMWPLAHDVRPAQQSLGWNGCSDCHSVDSGLFFSTLEGQGPLLTRKKEKRSSVEFMGASGIYKRFFGLTFLVRPILKIVLTFCGLTIAALFLFAGFQALGRISGLNDRR